WDRADTVLRCDGGLVVGDPDRACRRPTAPLTDLALVHLPLPEQLHRVAADVLVCMHVQVVSPLVEGDEAEPPVGIEPADGSLGHDLLLHDVMGGVPPVSPTTVRPAPAPWHDGTSRRSHLRTKPPDPRLLRNSGG